MMDNVYVVSAKRTAVGKAGRGTFVQTRPDDLAAAASKGAVDAACIAPEKIDDVVIGCATPEAEQGMNVARIDAREAGLPYTVPGMTINRFCSSGVQSIAIAAQAILAGSIDIAVAGGTESMTMIPMGGNKVSANPELMARYPEAYTGMGATAEIVATKFEVSREEQDRFAAESHRRMEAAQDAGRLSAGIIEVTTTVIGPEGSHEVTLNHDTINRRGTTYEGLAKLRPAFKPTGSVTAGNASPLTDGAAAVVVMSEEKAKELGITPIGYFHDIQIAGVDPDIMGTGPVPAIRMLLEKHNMKIEDIDLIELNEAFAAQSVYCVRELGLDAAKVNPNGGAIALGHPLGVSGTRMAGTLLNELNRRGGKWGIVSMCIGGGMGAAALFEAA
ncbi:MAG: thiolase family protein [Candidatus Hydrogenedentes bacterium]|nr:thiolase family protein [Candidatus Hydrogenedentota bacterium]